MQENSELKEKIDEKLGELRDEIFADMELQDDEDEDEVKAKIEVRIPDDMLSEVLRWKLT